MASDDIWRRDEVESPCVKVCVIHPEARLCVGCLRSIEEIARWSAMTPDERRQVIGELPARAGRIARRRGGRARGAARRQARGAGKD
ncbi:hypothetical protein SAMN05216257_10579 [Meinhardsimonia xiamenensis]|uniref:Fe-S protein n=1 Tax=Meinhardsimonia xiamenensis TaxID=990712 RepID=A0A1G9F812_9RHOB|nr:DUF1289 domain-containing protein [Meinhardsimonia xiamenensis]PRX37951.1 hypothetical protein LV81_00224 [Meinhardsimonia xiamenensis]SDK84500.1 hypothetical protein SAMN05216257_10579 [Meinhardsimonia xiamenensis]